MFYSREFKEIVRKVYPDCEKLQESMESGDDNFVRDFLNDNAPRAVSFDTILNATSLDELKRKTEEAKKKRDLYYHWLELKSVG